MKKRFTGLFLSLLILLLTVSGCGQGAGGGSAGAHDTDISGELVYEDSMELLYAEKLCRFMYVLCTLIRICPSKNFSAQFTIKTTLFDFYGVCV